MNYLFGILAAHIRVHIEPPLGIDRDTLSSIHDSLIIQIGIDDGLLLLRLGHNLRAGINDQAVTVGMVSCLEVTRRTAQSHIGLIVDCTSPAQKRPVQRPSGGVESARINKQESALARGNHRGLGESDVIANGEADFPVFRQIDNCQLIAWREHIALLERDLAGDINVKHVRLAVGADQGARGREDQRGIVVFIGIWFQFRNTSTDEVRFCFGGDRRERVERR